MAVTVERNRGSFSCEHCKWGRYCDASNPAPTSQWQIKIKGQVLVSSNICLLPLSDGHDLKVMIRSHGHYTNHDKLPFKGGVLDQPHVMMEAIELIDYVVNADADEAK